MRWCSCKQLLHNITDYAPGKKNHQLHVENNVFQQPLILNSTIPVIMIMILAIAFAVVVTAIAINVASNTVPLSW